jgi:hypothetical protein
VKKDVMKRIEYEDFTIVGIQSIFKASISGNIRQAPMGGGCEGQRRELSFAKGYLFAHGFCD